MNLLLIIALVFIILSQIIFYFHDEHSPWGFVCMIIALACMIRAIIIYPG